MAVIDNYVDPLIVNNTVSKLLRGINAHGAQLLGFYATVEKAAGDSDTSKWRFFKGLPPNLIPWAILVGCDALAGGTSFDLGLYNPNKGTVLSANCFMTAQTLAVAAKLAPMTALNGMGNVDQAVHMKRLYEYAGHTTKTKLAAYDMVLTGNTVGGAAGTISVLMIASQG